MHSQPLEPFQSVSWDFLSSAQVGSLLLIADGMNSMAKKLYKRSRTSILSRGSTEGRPVDVDLTEYKQT